MRHYKEFKVAFLPHNNPELEAQVREGCRFLETMANSEMFRDFVMTAPYIAEEPREVIYQKFMAGNAHLIFDVQPPSPNMNVGFSVNKDTKVISVYEGRMNYGIPKMAAILAHEYGHIIGFHHPRGTSWAGSFSYYLQYEGEKLFRKFYRKLKGKTYPRKGKWLIYEPWFKLLWFWKVLKRKDL